MSIIKIVDLFYKMGTDMKLNECLRIGLTDISAIYLLMNSILSLRCHFKMIK